MNNSRSPARKASSAWDSFWRSDPLDKKSAEKLGEKRKNNFNDKIKGVSFRMIINMVGCYVPSVNYVPDTYAGKSAFSFTNIKLNTKQTINNLGFTPWSLYGYTRNNGTGNWCLFGAVRSSSDSTDGSGWKTQNQTDDSVISRPNDFTFNANGVSVLPYDTVDVGSGYGWVFGKI